MVGEGGPVRLAGTGNNKFVAVYASQTDNIDLADGSYETNLYGRYFNGSAWETEALLDNQPGAIDPEGVIWVTMAIDGSALVVWTQIDGDFPPEYGNPDQDLVVYGSSFDGMGNWAAVPTKLSYNTCGIASNNYGGLTMGASGNGIATFHDRPFPDCVSVVKVHYLAGSGWQLQAVDDPTNRPTDREALTGPTGYSSKNRMAGQADGKAIILFRPYSNTFPITSFSALEFGD